MKIILKVLALPAILVLSILNFVMNIVLEVYSLGAGILFIVLGLCIIAAIAGGMWHNLIFLVCMVGAVILLSLAIGFVMGQIKVMRSELIGFLKA